MPSPVLERLGRLIHMRSPLEMLAFISAVIRTPKRRDERGAAITEYVVLIGFVVLAVTIFATTGVWTTLKTKIDALIATV